MSSRTTSSDRWLAEVAGADRLVELAVGRLDSGARQSLQTAIDKYRVAVSCMASQEDHLNDRVETVLKMAAAVQMVAPMLDAELLRKYLRCSERALSSAAEDIARGKCQGIASHVHLCLGNVLLELAHCSLETRAKSLRELAEQSLRYAIELPDDQRRDDAALYDGLGRALRDQAVHYAGELSFAKLIEAEEAFERSLRLSELRAGREQYGTTLNNLAGTRACQAEYLVGAARRKCLSEVVGLFKRMAQLCQAEQDSVGYSRAIHNLGSALVDRARQQRREKREHDLDQAIECYRRAFQGFTRSAFPAAYANTQLSLGNALLEASRTRVEDERLRMLMQADAAYTRASETMTAMGESLVIANLHVTRLHCELAMQSRTPIHHIEHASRLIGRLKRQCTRLASPDDYAEVQRLMANLLIRQAQMRAGRGRSKALVGALACARRALTTYASLKAPWHHSKAMGLLAIVYSNLAAHTKGRQKVLAARRARHYGMKAIRSLRAAEFWIDANTLAGELKSLLKAGSLHLLSR